MKIFIVTVDENRGEKITAEELKQNIQEELYNSPVNVKEIL